MGVLTEATGQGDVVLVRGATNRWGVMWEQSTDRATYTPVDLSGWSGLLVLRSPMGDVWASIPVFPSISGLTEITVGAADLVDPAWAGRAGGSWAVNLTDPDGRIERLAQGYFHMEA